MPHILGLEHSLGGVANQAMDFFGLGSGGDGFLEAKVLALLEL